MTTRTRQENCPNHYTYHAKTTTGILRPRKRKETRNLFVRTKGVGWKCLTRVMRSHSQTCAQVAKQESLTAVHSTHPTVSGILVVCSHKTPKVPWVCSDKGWCCCVNGSTSARRYKGKVSSKLSRVREKVRKSRLGYRRSTLPHDHG